MKSYIYILMALSATMSANASTVDGDTLVLDLPTTISMAQHNSPSAQSARNSYLAAYWNYRYFRANYLPSVTMTSSPYINKEINKITQSDGSALFLKQNQLGADVSLKVNQNIALTGGSLFVKSSLTRLDELGSNTTAYSSQPLMVGYEQSLFGYNSLKWDKRMEPLRYEEAIKSYAETLELISAESCNRFFALAMAINVKEMARQNYASADTLYHMAQGRYEIGTITENEMLQLEINRLNEETSMMDAEIALEDAMQSFRSYLGLDQRTLLTIVIPDTVPQFEVPIQEALALALENSPDPRYYELMRMESSSNLAYAKANSGLKADIYMQLGLSQTGRDVASAYNDPNNQMSVSIAIQLPVLDWGRRKGRVRVAQSQLDMANTKADQGMRDFGQNVKRLVMQFNMQGRKVSVASMTDHRADHRHAVARKLYMMGRNSILDLNAAVNEKNSARRNYIAAMHSYWQLYYTIRSMTGYDFEKGMKLAWEVPDIVKP